MYRAISVTLVAATSLARAGTVGAVAGVNFADSSLVSNAIPVIPGPTLGGFYRFGGRSFELQVGAQYSFRMLFWRACGGPCNSSSDKVLWTFHDLEAPVVARFVASESGTRRYVPLVGLSPSLALRQREHVLNLDQESSPDLFPFDVALLAGFSVDWLDGDRRYGLEARLSVGLAPRRSDYDGGADKGTLYAGYVLFTVAGG